MTGVGLIFRDHWVNHVMKLIFPAGPELDPRPRFLHGRDYHSAGHRAVSGLPCRWLSPGCPVYLCLGSVHHLAPGSLTMACMWRRCQGQGPSSCSLHIPCSTLGLAQMLGGCNQVEEESRSFVQKTSGGRVVGHLAWGSGLS